MCNQSRTKLEEKDDGTLVISIDPWDVWNNISDERKEYFLEDAGTWHIIESNLKYELQRGVSSDNFSPSTQRLRELITTDPEFVPDVVVACIKQLLEDKASAIQEKRESDQAFWRLRNAVNNHYQDIPYPQRPEWAKHIETGYDIGRDDEYMRFTTAEVRQEILDAFFKSLI